ncbi:MAG: 50S ribosomal protein L6 [Patescibacteria group bacterium]
MSKIGKLPVQIPDGVTVSIEPGLITVKGPKGENTVPTLDQFTTVTQVEKELIVTRADDEKEAKSMHGLTRSLLRNAIQGVTEGFSKTLEINGVGFRAEAKGPEAITLHLGFSHPVEVAITPGVEYKIEKNQVVLSGIDKQKVGHMAALIRSKKKPEPYKGKGIKYLDEVIIRKAGKAAKA